MQDVSPFARKLMSGVAVVLATLAVGAIDIATGADVHVFSLYFVPLALAGWQLGRAGAAAASMLATLVWLAALYDGGARYAHRIVWVVNFCTQAAAFLTVSMLVAVLCETLEQEKHLRRTDTLTGLRNRSAFMEQAAIALPPCRRHERPVSIAYLDLDNFKNANDSFGHAFGDALLRRCAGLIAGSVRSSDIVARLGGDEFVILLPETQRGEAEALLARIVLAIEAMDDCRAAGVTASVGVVVDERASRGIVELLELADAQMYRVKQGGKNAVATRPIDKV